MTAPIQKPRGTRDFGPEETYLRHQVAERIRSVFHRFGYQEVQTPTFEELALFTAKSGAGVIEELYAFQDKGGRDLCLRPELTAPVMRMYHEAHFNDPKPLKWYYFGNCFRYDRPQAGRYREFWQFGCEQVGAGSPLAYAELLAMASAVYDELGLQARELAVGHVRILAHAVDAFGFDAPTRAALMRAIDKRDDAEVRRLAAGKEGSATAVDRLFLVMDAPTLDAAAAALDGAMAAELAELRELFAHLEGMGVQGVRLN
ncbi:MAG TPA: ATP phosphoribosyltransferase regulatory subunit, partial [Candidatus Thermoplasmatota archaeon]|nr:ATP phosphoribosyltransferase regulatory subunit [Candidatus Thermoplasmatota archaeon]